MQYIRPNFEIHSLLSLYCGCLSLFCNVWVCLCVCVRVRVCVGFVICGCFGNMCTHLYLLCFVLFVLFFFIVSFMIFNLICFLCTSVRTTATE